MKIGKKISVYLIIFCIAFFATACTSNNITLEANAEIIEEGEKGSFKKGGFMFSDYWISLECPYSGHPSGTIDSLWSTYYNDENSVSVFVDIFGVEGNSDTLIDELANNGIKVSEDVLWDNECYFYTDDVTVAIIPLGKNDYLKIVFKHRDGLTVESSSIPDTFTLEVTQVYLREEDETSEAEIMNKDAETVFAEFLAGDRTCLEETQEDAWFIPDFLDDSIKYEYTYLDLDEDNVNELLIQAIDGPGCYNGVFHYEDGKIFCWNSDSVEMTCYDYPLRDGTMVRQYNYAGTRSYDIFWYNSDGTTTTYTRLFARDELISEDSSEKCPYYEIDGMELNAEDFELNLEVLVTDYLLEHELWTEIKL